MYIVHGWYDDIQHVTKCWFIYKSTSRDCAIHYTLLSIPLITLNMLHLTISPPPCTQYCTLDFSQWIWLFKTVPHCLCYSISGVSCPSKWNSTAIHLCNIVYGKNELSCVIVTWSSSPIRQSYALPINFTKRTQKNSHYRNLCAVGTYRSLGA